MSLRHATNTQRAVRSLPLGHVVKTVASGQ